MALKFNTNVAERLNLKVRNVWELIPTSAEVITEKLVGGGGGGGFFNITNLICDTLNMLLYSFYGMTRFALNNASSHMVNYVICF